MNFKVVVIFGLLAFSSAFEKLNVRWLEDFLQHEISSFGANTPMDSQSGTKVVHMLF
jgi:hypothetical protein